jgi:threonine synthase
MDHVTSLRCMICGRDYKPGEVSYTCPNCGPEGILDVIYDYGLIGDRLTRDRLAGRREPSIWRYTELLPVEPDGPRPPLQIGWTPLIRADRLGWSLGCENLLIKNDGRNPTASFKDRASAVGVVKALEGGHGTIACASTGNAASSLAGVAASAGLETVIFVPRTAPRAKVAQLLIHGARVFLVRGSYDQAFDLCREAVDRYGWYSRNTASNPYLSEGKKTAALEICEQLDWNPPDTVFVSVGDGCIIGGLWKGFHDLQQLGFIDRVPRLAGVQARGCQPIKRAWETDRPVVTVTPETMADSIAVGHPRDALKALRAVRRSGGFMLAVSDEEILQAMRLMASKIGIFGEPAGVTGFAGLIQALSAGRLEKNERVVVVMTGHGLKDVEGALRATRPPVEIDPTLEALAEQMGEQG